VTIEGLSIVIPRLKEHLENIQGHKIEVIESAEINIKYSGYIHREKLAAEKLQRLEQISLSDNFDYNSLQSLSTEARQKLSRIKPKTIGEASRIPGVSPNDISVLLVLLGR
jgi:tRNA uridine 5-carboxymethylaminomethyl modification enzyme